MVPAIAPVSVQPKDLQCCRLWIAVEDRINVLHNIRTDIEEIPFVLDRYEGTLGTVISSHLEGLSQGAERLNIALDTHVTKHKQRGADGCLSYCGVTGNEERDSNLGFNSIADKV